MTNPTWSTLLILPDGTHALKILRLSAPSETVGGKQGTGLGSETKAAKRLGGFVCSQFHKAHVQKQDPSGFVASPNCVLRSSFFDLRSSFSLSHSRAVLLSPVSRPRPQSLSNVGLFGRRSMAEGGICRQRYDCTRDLLPSWDARREWIIWVQEFSSRYISSRAAPPPKAAPPMGHRWW